MSGKLKGKIAVVTGASKGIGAEIARQFGAEGATVIVNYSSSKAGADKVVSEITAKGGKALALQANLSKPAEVQKFFAEVKKAHGRVDILVNNAGIYEFAPLNEITPEHFYKLFDLNVLGLLLTTQEAAKLVGPEGASFINISSVVSTVTPPNAAVYSATKASVDAITLTFAKELAPRKIRVNAINPGMIETEGVQSAGIDKGDMRKWVESVTPLGRIGQVGEIAPAAVFLAASDSSYLTGETIKIAGGFR